LQPNSITDTNISPTALIQGTKLAFTGGGFIISSGARTNGLLYLTNAPGVITMLGPGLMITNMTTTIPLTNNAGTSTTTNWTGPTIVLQQFTSGLYSLPGGVGVVANVAHNLGVTPSWVRWVLICQTGENGYPPGYEIAVEVLGPVNADGCFAGGADSTNVCLTLNSPNIYGMNKTNPAQNVTFTKSYWQAKCYARP
jgi:hypothetical protein